MKPAPFHYVAARDVDEIVSALEQHGGEARLLAGGQSLVPMMNFRVATPSVLIDINGVSELGFIDPQPDCIEIGALTRHAMLEDSEVVRARLPLVAEAMGQIAHRAVRNRGTMGGSLALAYPGAELPLLFVTLGAELKLRSARGERRVTADAFILGALDTALADDEFIHSACLPALPPRAGSAFIEVSRRHGDFALAASAAVIDLDARCRVRHVQAGVSGGGGRPIRLREAERALMGQPPAKSLIEEVARTAIGSIEVEDERNYPAGYRKLLLGTVLQQALETATARAEPRDVA
jgi:carbon-monoxide dehydrogenase medium subunit